MKKVFFAFCFTVFIGKIYAQQPEIFSVNNKAINGYDPVAFFPQQMPVYGNDSLVYEWKKANWYFASNENLQKFIAAPQMYAPQYGGYCAFGTSDGEGHKAPTEVDTWTIKNDKLYFNYNKKVKTHWLKRDSALIEKANINWEKIKDN
jgi:YHS domain-containing protein